MTIETSNLYLKIGSEYNERWEGSMINEIDLRLNSILDTGEIIFPLVESNFQRFYFFQIKLFIQTRMKKI